MSKINFRLALRRIDKIGSLSLSLSLNSFDEDTDEQHSIEVDGRRRREVQKRDELEHDRCVMVFKEAGNRKRAEDEP